MLILTVILMPIIFGLVLPFIKLKKVPRNIYVVTAALLTSIVALYLVFGNIDINYTLINITDKFSIGFSNDGLSKIFTIIVAFLWPLATLYATEYMEHEKNRDSFFRYYLIAYGITLGVAFSNNLISMYFFYEALTFLTLPLIMHKADDKKSLYAGKVYLILSLLGASTALTGIIILSTLSQNINFVYGGVLQNTSNNVLINIAYILCFLGFGVKTAIIPFTFWLPLCGVAPTPVSALLHAVAVVKAGVFAIMRVTFFSFGAETLNGSAAQKIAFIFVSVTIVYSSVMALRDRHIKRRLAYSTASNLSYILFAVVLMTAEGFAAGMQHMMFHAIAKINLFFVAGAIMIYANREYVQDMKGIAKKMPISMFAFLLASLSMIGIPLTCGFISKYSLITSAINAGGNYAYIGIASIVISTMLTLVYLFTIVLNAYVPGENFDGKRLDKISESGIAMKITFIIISIMIIYFGVNSTSLIEFIDNVAKGVI